MKKRWNRLLSMTLAGILAVTAVPVWAVPTEETGTAEEIYLEGEHAELIEADIADQETEPEYEDGIIDQETGSEAEEDIDQKIEGKIETESEAAEKELVIEEDLDLTELALPDSDELAASYIEQQFYGDFGISFYSSFARDRLTGPDRNFYDLMAERIHMVASGETASAMFTFLTTDIMGQEVFYGSDLGIGTISADNAEAAARLALSYNRSLVLDALANDMPSELFWFNKAVGGMKTNYKISYTSKYVRISTINVKMTVSQDYRGDSEFSVDTERLQSVATAVENARQIVSDAEALTDLEKLYRYRQEICDLTDYNHEAVLSSYTRGYGDPWQMVYVFDGDPATKVVCEGYSKAFQYLMDETAFSSEEIYSYIVTGRMSGGAHMWNILHMDDGRNYMVDVTNSDSLGYSGDILRFMQIHSKGNADNGYVFSMGSSSGTTYVYDDDTKALFSKEDLTLSRGEYGEEEPPFSYLPVENVQAGIKAKATFCVKAVGADYYQWEYSKNGSKWYESAADGADTEKVSFTVSASNSVNIYRCKITAFDGTVHYTNTAGIIIVDGVEILSQPVSGALLMGQEQTFSVEAINAAENGYQWQYSKDGSHWYNSGASGSNTDTLTVMASISSQGNRYRCVILGIDGNKKKSATATMIVLRKEPVNSGAAVGETAVFSLKADGIVSYQWQYSKDGGKTWYRSGAEGNTTESISFRVTSTNRGNLYRCKLITEDGAYAFTKIVSFI